MKIFTAQARLAVVMSAILSSGPLLAQGLDLENSEDDRIAYSIGVNIGQSLIAQGLLNDIDMDVFVTGLRDIAGDDVKMPEEEIFASIQLFQQRMIESQQAELVNNLETSQQFLTENAAKDGVVALDSGLQYLVLESGPDDAASPSATDSVLAHYHGTLTDGSVFDSSVDRGEPAQFGLSQVIPGWTEALQLMTVGDKWRLFIPPGLAYGESPPPGVIPPNSALIFDVELLEIR